MGGSPSIQTVLAEKMRLRISHTNSWIEKPHHWVQVGCKMLTNLGMKHKWLISPIYRKGLFLESAPELKTIESFFLMLINHSKMVTINKAQTAFSRETTKWQPSNNSKKYGKMPWKRSQIIRTSMKTQAVDTTSPCRKFKMIIRHPESAQLLTIRWFRHWAKQKRGPRKKSIKSITARTRVCYSIIFRELNNKDHLCSLGNQTELQINNHHYLQCLRTPNLISNYRRKVISLQVLSLVNVLTKVLPLKLVAIGL